MAPRSARTWIPGRPLAFITTTVHDPSAGSHRRACGLGPVVEAAQKVCVPGADRGAPPAMAWTLFVQRSEMSVWLTPAR